MLSSILEIASNTTTVTIQGFLICTLASLILGVLAAMIYMYRNSYHKNFVLTLALMPAMIQIVIMLVNGNIGAGIAVAGAFSLVRFRSAAGSGQEITSIFLAMAVGLATGMGYIGIAILFTIIITFANVLLQRTGFGAKNPEERTVKITVPENLDFEGIFDDIFDKYATKAELIDVKTSGMGSLYKLSYKVFFRKKASVKGMMDEIRQRNGNLEISCMRAAAIKSDEL